jgi:acetyl esterase/lipase
VNASVRKADISDILVQEIAMESRTPSSHRLPRIPGRHRFASAAVPGRIRILLDVPYAAGTRNKLDLYLPDRAGFTVALFVHGGGWCQGDKSMYADVGNYLARQGIGAVLVNYRLSPEVRHPAHVQDVAAAVAWVWRHIASYGGDAGRLSLSGHSAGGHLVSLLATDETLLRPWGLSPKAIQGVVTISGVYCIGMNVSLYGLGHVFRGADKRAASPLWQVKPGCPPFLILHAQRDTWTLARQARKLHARIVANNGWARLVAVAGQTHDSIIHSAVVPGAPHGRQIVRFLLDG